MKCVQCGKELAASVKFCTNCGTPVEEEQSVVMPDLEISNNHNENNDFDNSVDEQNANDLSQESAIEKLKKNWNDKYTIITLGVVMLIAVLIGFIIKNNIEPKQATNDIDYQNSYEDYEIHEDYEDYNVIVEEQDSDYTDSVDSFQDYVQQDVEENDDDSQEYILPESDTKYLTKSDLVGLTAEECRLARNEIYARHGRMFNDEELQKYFESFDWYTPTIQPNDFQESMLNVYEIANRDLIVEYEKEQGYR